MAYGHYWLTSALVNRKLHETEFRQESSCFQLGTNAYKCKKTLKTLYLNMKNLFIDHQWINGQMKQNHPRILPKTKLIVSSQSVTLYTNFFMVWYSYIHLRVSFITLCKLILYQKAFNTTIYCRIICWDFQVICPLEN